VIHLHEKNVGSVWVNPDHIAVLAPAPHAGTIVTMGHGASIVVEEPADQIAAQMRGR